MTQRASLTEAEKQFISLRKGQGISLAEIAKEIQCSFETVRKWWRYRRDQRQANPRGRPAGGILSTYPPALIQEAIRIKQAHPFWGPPMVKLELHKHADFAANPLPSDARLSALFKQQCPDCVQPRSWRAYPEKAPRRVSCEHVRWQIDAKEGVRYGQTEFASLLEIRDPAAGVILASQAFQTTTPKHWRKLTLREIQNVLRLAFLTWGMPLEIQTDREVVYVGSADHNFPSPFTLWLVGLGIQHVVGRSYRPTDQAQIERNHRTLSEMAWKGQTLESLEQLQALLDEYRQLYNELYPSEAADCQGQPPLQAHPAARFSGRSYHQALEEEWFDLQRVDQFLSQQVWTRKVTSNGVVVFGDHRYYVGRAYHGQMVSGQFRQENRCLRFQTLDGTFIKEVLAKGLEKEDLLGFIPLDQPLPVGFQFQLPFVGV